MESTRPLKLLEEGAFCVHRIFMNAERALFENKHLDSDPHLPTALQSRREQCLSTCSKGKEPFVRKKISYHASFIVCNRQNIGANSSCLPRHMLLSNLDFTDPCIHYICLSTTSKKDLNQCNGDRWYLEPRFGFETKARHDMIAFDLFQKQEHQEHVV